MRTAGADVRDSAARLRVAHLLEVARLEPSGRSPNAILIVRRLADPLPRRLARAADAVSPSNEWERAAGTALAHCFDRAARPIDGPVPPSANAVRFDDESELLACLARDYLAGDAPARWWWRALFQDTSHDALAMLVSAWLQRPRAIPAAIACLASNGASTPFVSALSSGQVRSLFVAVADAFDLRGLVAAAMEPLPPVDPPRSATTEFTESAEARPSIESVATSIDTEHAAVPPWQPFIAPLVVPTLDVERQTLLGIALALWRAPLAVRTRRFEQAFRAWRQAIHRRVARDAARSASAAVLSSPRRIDPARDEDSVRPIDKASNRNDDAMPASEAYVEPAVNGAQAAQPTESIGTLAEPVDRTSARLADRIAHPYVPAPDSASHANDDGGNGPAVEAIAVRKAGGELVDRDTGLVPAFADNAHDPRSSVQPVSGLRHEQPIVTTHATEATTELGGLLFLINALDDERLWERFADTQDPDSPTGGWSWLALVARRLLGTRADGDLDPIWRALAALDGRDAVGLDAPPLLDIVVPPLRARLLSALGIDESSADAEALLAQRLLFRRGHLRWDATHVDLHMAMAQIDIAVRLAGLDANPGWVPALGRVVTFYFE